MQHEEDPADPWGMTPVGEKKKKKKKKGHVVGIPTTISWTRIPIPLKEKQKRQQLKKTL